MTILYRTSATSNGGRAGTSRSSDGNLAVTLTTPKELGGDGAAGTNPEQLFAAGYSACFLGALKYVANQAKVKLSPETTVTANVGIGPRADGGGFGIEVDLVAHVPDVDPAVAEDLVAKAHVACPYSHAMRTATEVKVSLA
jgi:Ohr subfamily peroxiredoxin